jgi:uncharacterized protein YuzE
MKITYDPEVDILRIMFRDASISESDEEQPGLIFDYDSDRRIVGIEILDASQNIENDRAIDGFVAVANHR